MEKSKFVMPRLSHNRTARYFVSDSETEGLSGIKHRPWEFAFSVHQGNKVLEAKSLYPWYPDLKVGAMAAKITGFQFEKYKDLATPKEEVWEEIRSYIYNPDFLLVGHNWISFDSMMVKRLATDCGDWRGWEVFIERVIDTMCLSRMYHNGTKPDPDNFLGSQIAEIGRPPRGSKKSNLAAMCKELSVPVDETMTHRGSYDCELTYAVLNKLIYATDI